MKSEDTKGLFMRRGTWHYQPRMVAGIRPTMIDLETSDLSVAIEARKLVLDSPKLAAITDSRDVEIERFLAAPFKGKKFYTESSKKALRYNLKGFFARFPEKLPIADISREQVQAYYDDSLAKKDDHTAHKRLMAVRAFYKRLHAARKVRVNPAIGVVTAQLSAAPRVVFCTKEERAHFFKTCNREDLMFVLMTGFHAGMRKQEIINMPPAWVNLEQRFLDLHSTATFKFNDHKRARTIPLRGELHTYLTNYGLPEPYLLRPDVEKGKAIYRWDFEVPLTKLSDLCDIGKKVTTHVLRHTFASLLVIDGISLFKVAKWLGDSIATTEKHYAHLLPMDEDIEEKKERHAKKARKAKSKG